LDKYGGIKSTIEKLNHEVEKLRAEVDSLNAQKQVLDGQVQTTISNLAYSKQIADFCNGVAESIKSEILRELSIIALITYTYNYIFHFQNLVTLDTNLQKFMPLIKADRGESVPIEGLKMSVTKAIDIMIDTVNPIDKSIANILSDARIALLK
jgi:hypothetical protein